MSERLEDIRRKAIELLARREYAAAELKRKLTARGFDTAAVGDVLSALAAEDLLSDSRFCESYAHSRVAKGYGPVRIRQDLRERGVTDELIARCLDGYERQWEQRLEEVRRKRFGEPRPKDYREQTRQARFLKYRGFSHEQIRHLLGAVD